MASTSALALRRISGTLPTFRARVGASRVAVAPVLQQRRTAVTTAAVKTGTAASQLLKADIPPLEDPLLHFMASLIMRHGMRHRASKTISLMLQHVHTMTGSQPMDVLRQAVLRAAPSVKILKQKRGMKVVMQPVPLSERQRTRKAILWIIEASMFRPGSRLSERLAKEVVGICQNSSQALTWKEGEHSSAMVSRAAVKVPAILRRRY
ncbi:ribosomal protein S7 [Auricularia subglabra TFB-10046 SS5]|nr:ribosomal protein S7 [Auricularia subglabra TFB-10046 SS5]